MTRTHEPSLPAGHVVSVQPGWDHVQMTQPGELEVMQVRRVLVRKSEATPEDGEEAMGTSTTVISLSGVPGSRRSTATSARIIFMPAGSVIPRPAFDAELFRINLFYSGTELMEVMKVLGTGKERFCYFWRTKDGTKRLAWMLAMP